MNDSRTLLLDLRSLASAFYAGNASEVRTIGQRMLDAHPAVDFVREAVGVAWLACGFAADALPLLPRSAHAHLARAHAELGQFVEARRELMLARAAGLDVANLTLDVEHAANAAGLPNDVVLRTEADGAEWAGWIAATERIAVGQHEAGWRDLIAVMDAYPCTKVGAKALQRLGRPPCPRWDGKPVGHLVVVANGGVGDLFQWGRAIRDARRLCDRITVVAEAARHPLIQRGLPVDAVVAPAGLTIALQAADAYAPHGMMGYLIGGPKRTHGSGPWRIKPLPGTVPDLGPGMHVGICWGASASQGRNRSIPFAALEPLQSLDGFTFHSLQKGIDADDAGPWVRRHEMQNWEGTTSLIAALDAVVSVDTAVAHLACNVGVRTHLLLCAHQDWRWGMGDRTPWYPTMRIHRGAPGDAVAGIARALVATDL